MCTGGSQDDIGMVPWLLRYLHMHRGEMYSLNSVYYNYIIILGCTWKTSL